MSIQPNAEQGAQSIDIDAVRSHLDRAADLASSAQSGIITVESNTELAKAMLILAKDVPPLLATVTQQASENQALRQEIEALHTSVFDAGIAQGRAHAAGVIRTAQAYRMKRDEYGAHEALYHEVGLDECDECGRLHNEALGLEAEMVRALDFVEQEVPS